MGARYCPLCALSKRGYQANMRNVSSLAAIIATLTIMLTAITSPALAQQAAPQVVTQFDDPTISRLLTDVQATWRIEMNEQGEANYRASAEGGLNFTLAPRACSPETGCLGLMALAVYTGIDTSNTAQLDALLNDLNDRSATAKVYRSSGGVVILQAYINSSYGISYANAQSQLLVFGQNIVSISQALAGFENGS